MSRTFTVLVKSIDDTIDPRDKLGNVREHVQHQGRSVNVLVGLENLSDNVANFSRFTALAVEGGHETGQIKSATIPASKWSTGVALASRHMFSARCHLGSRAEGVVRQCVIGHDSLHGANVGLAEGIIVVDGNVGDFFQVRHSSTGKAATPACSDALSDIIANILSMAGSSGEVAKVHDEGRREANGADIFSVAGDRALQLHDGNVVIEVHWIVCRVDIHLGNVHFHCVLFGGLA